MKKKSYRVEISIFDGQIMSSSCDCPRGLDTCHHMCAIAFFVHYNVSITDLACSGMFNILNFKPISNDIEEIHITAFYEDLKECGPTGFSWLLSPDPIINSSDYETPNIKNILFSKEFHLTKNKNEYLKQKLALTLDAVLKIKDITIGQIDNPLWLITRKNRLTASNFGKVLRAHRRAKYPPSLFKTLSGTYNLHVIKQIQWGRNNEKVAISAFEKLHSRSVIQSGIWLSLSGVLGASPDGIVEDAVVEVKCPYKYRNNKLYDAIKNEKNYIITIENGSYIINKNHDYYHQIQGKLYMCNKLKCYLIVWTCIDIVIVMIEKDLQWISNINILENFFFDKFVPYLLAGSV
ncbi:hypothetical protein RN001_005791 [Aquatica leii]|uniref:SWIM-type domain-containing protein n=1 Tax=Aquatica leii TaxID=1421715 RepID=A0AAN7Q1S4_9COLE|nr:hypothetical protein RN001_005791 [Aquatica leii]